MSSFEDETFIIKGECDILVLNNIISDSISKPNKFSTFTYTHIHTSI